MTYSLICSDDGLATILHDGAYLGRALTMRDGEVLVVALNKNTTALRDKLTAEITDAIENAFDGVGP